MQRYGGMCAEIRWHVCRDTVACGAEIEYVNVLIMLVCMQSMNISALLVFNACMSTNMSAYTNSVYMQEVILHQRVLLWRRSVLTKDAYRPLTRISKKRKEKSLTKDAYRPVTRNSRKERKEILLTKDAYRPVTRNSR